MISGIAKSKIKLLIIYLHRLTDGKNVILVKNPDFKTNSIKFARVNHLVNLINPLSCLLFQHQCPNT